MGHESKPTLRASDPTKPSQRGVVAVQRRDVPVTGITFTIPTKARWVVFQNGHPTNHLRFNFNSDGVTNFFTLPANSGALSRTHEIEITDSTDINLKGVDGDSVVEAIFRG
jgi:hypothetical protein